MDALIYLPVHRFISSHILKGMNVRRGWRRAKWPLLRAGIRLKVDVGKLGCTWYVDSDSRSHASPEKKVSRLVVALVEFNRWFDRWFRDALIV